MDRMIPEREFDDDWGAACKPNGELFDYADVKDLDRHLVWTVVDTGGSDRNWYALPGFHIVNKLGYVTTTRPWVTGREEAIWFEY